MASALASSSFLSAAAPRPSTVARAIGRQPDQRQRPLGGLEGRGPRVPALAVEAREHHVLDEREPAERPRDLERAADAEIDDPVRRLAADLATLEADRPAFGARVPESMLKIVLLPEPFGPIRPRISPCSTANDTLLTAVNPPKRLVEPLDGQHRSTPSGAVRCARERAQFARVGRRRRQRQRPARAAAGSSARRRTACRRRTG